MIVQLISWFIVLVSVVWFFLEFYVVYDDDDYEDEGETFALRKERFSFAFWIGEKE